MGEEILISALEDPSYDVQNFAANVLGEIKDVRAVDALILGLPGNSRNLSNIEIMEFGEALIKIGKPSVKPLKAMLNMKNKSACIIAVKILMRINDASAVETLVGALKDDNINDYARETLVKIGAPAVVPLIAVLRDKDPLLREQAILVLGDIKDARAVEPLIAAFRKHENCVFKDTLIKALVNIGKPAIEALTTVLNDKSRVMRKFAASVLGDIKDPSAIGPLAAALNDEDAYVQESVVKALGKMHDSRVIMPLIHVLTDKDWDLCFLAGDIIVDNTEKNAIPSILKLIGGEECARVTHGRLEYKLLQKGDAR